MNTSSKALITSTVKSDIPDSLQDIFSHTFECIARVDYNGCYLSVSPAYAEVNGYAQEEMIGQQWRETVHPDDMDLVSEKFQLLLDTGRAEAKVRGVRKNRSVFYKQLLMVKGLESDVTSVHHYCFIKDITEKVLDELNTLKNVKTGLEYQEQQFHNLIKNIPGVIFRCDLKHYWAFSYISEGIQKLLGYEAHQLSQSGEVSYESLIHEDDRVRVKEIIDNAISKPQTYIAEYRVLRKDGEVRWLRERGSSMPEADGTVGWVGGIIRDITDSREERKRGEIANNFINKSAEVVFWLNEEGKFVYANDRACKAFGYSINELLNMYGHDIDKNFTPEKRVNYLKTLRNSPGQSVQFESFIWTKSNRKVPYKINSHLISFGDEVFTSVMARDISNERRVEQLYHIDQTVLKKLLDGENADECFRVLCDLVEEINPDWQFCILPGGSGNMGFDHIIRSKRHEISDRKLSDSLRKLHGCRKESSQYAVIGDIYYEEETVNRLWPQKQISIRCWVKSFCSVSTRKSGLLAIIQKDQLVPSDTDYDFLDKVTNAACMILDTVSSRVRLLQYEKITQSADEMMVFVDTDFYIRTVNENYAQARNFTITDLTDRFFPEIVGDDIFYNSLQPKLQRCFGGEYIEYRKKLHMPRYGDRNYKIKIEPVEDESGIVGATLLLNDVTEVSNISGLLRETQEKYEQIVNHSQDMIVISRCNDDCIVSINPAVERILGYRENELVNQKSGNYYASSADRILVIEKIKEHSHIRDHEVELKNREGKVLSMTLSSSLLIENGEECIFSVYRDQSSQKQAEKELEEVQINFARAIKESPESIIIIRIDDGKVLDVNNATLDATGYKREEITEHGNGRMFWIDEGECEKYVKQLLLKERIANHFMYALRKDGTSFPCLMSSTVIEVNGEKCAFNIINDMSELKPDSGIASMNKSNYLPASENVLLTYHDRDLRYQYANTAFLDEFNLELDSLIGMKIRDLTDDNTYRQMELCYEKALKGQNAQCDFVFEDSNQSLNRYLLHCHPIVIDDDVSGIYVTSTNVSNRQEAEILSNNKNRALNVLSELNKGLSTVDAESELWKEVSSILVKTGRYNLAGVLESSETFPGILTIRDDTPDGQGLTNVQKEYIRTQLGVLQEKISLSRSTCVITDFPDNNNVLDWIKEKDRFTKLSIIGLPLPSDGQPHRFLFVYSDAELAFSDEEKSIFESIRDSLIYGSHLIQETEKRIGAEKLISLENRIFQFLETSYELDTLMSEIADEVGKKLDDTQCTVLLTDKKSKKLNRQFFPGKMEQMLTPVLAAIEAGESNPLEDSLYQNKEIVIGDLENTTYKNCLLSLVNDYSVQSCRIVPIGSDSDTPLGIIVLLSTSAEACRSGTRNIIVRAGQLIANAIYKYRSDELLKENEERFALAMQGSQDGLWDWNVLNNEVYFSPRWKSMLGYKENELENSVETFQDLLHPSYKNICRDFLKNFREHIQVELKLRHKLGHYVDILSRATGIRKSEGEVVRLVGTHTDLTEKNRVALRIKQTENQFRTLYDDSPAMFLTLDSEGTILSINKYGAQNLGYTVDLLVGKSIDDITHSEDIKKIRNKLDKAVKTPDTVQRCEVRYLHQFGDSLWVRATMRSILSDYDSENILVTCEDISEARILSEQLEYQARHDALTGLINRVEFEKRLRRIISNDRDENDHALCHLDLDQFKVINDTCGHLAGDELIRRVSDILNTVVRKRDTLARMGGDEFAVLLEHCSIEQAKRVAAELLRSIETLRFVWEGKRFNLGVSIGLVPMKSGTGTVTDILSAADAACYAAKDAGRNRIQVFFSDDKELSRRRGEMEWVSRINQALEEDLFSLEAQHIQPLIFSSNKYRGNHYELLLRMRTNEGELIYPGAFLPAAERYNISSKIDRWLIDAVMNWLGNDQREVDELAICSINLSGTSIGDRDFHRYILDQFKGSHIPPGKICFEITETAAIANLGAAIQMINSLKEIGCLFALDDFGTGVSSFNYLKNLPVDFLKIDGSFIKDIHNDPIDYAMVKSINEIGQVLGKKTIAEFVENEQILEVLKEIGVDYAQGYAIGKSKPVIRGVNKN